MPSANWLEISLTLDGELAEAVADVLARYAHQGVSIESTAIEVDPDDEGRPIGPLRVRAFIPADESLEATRQKIEQDLFYLGMIRPLPTPVYTPVADADWAELWKAQYHPIRVGRRLVIVPVWLADIPIEGGSALHARPPDTPIQRGSALHARPSEQSRPQSRLQAAPTQPPDYSTTRLPDRYRATIRLLMNPGMAFGTGTHPTTQLCLALLEDHLKPDDTVLDLGCGSGILSVAAAKLGARSVLSADIDAESIRATNENAQANGVADKIETRLGSLASVGGLKFEVSVANILAIVIVKLLGEGLAQTLAPNGLLIVSGILAEQADHVVAALNNAGLNVIDIRQNGDWVALAAQRTT